MAKGCTQREEVDYEENFSIVVRIALIHTILVSVARVDLEFVQMDV